MPFRESGFCIALGLTPDGRADRIYVIKCQQGDCWIGHVAESVEAMGPECSIILATVFKEDKYGFRLCRTLKMEGLLVGSD